MYGIHLVSVDILVFISEIHKSSIFFSDLASIYCEIHEILIIKSLLFVIFWSPPLISGQCTSQIGSDFRSQESEGSDLYLFCICFPWNKLVLFASFIYILHLLSGNCLNSPVACLSIDLIQSQTCFRWFALSVHYKSSIFLCKSLDFHEYCEDFILKYCQILDLLDCYPFIVWFFSILREFSIFATLNI